jgi:hypothetical protein
MTGRIYIMYGQGGIVTSFGMYQLSQRISKRWPSAVVTTHSWDDPNAIAEDMVKSVVPRILIGYSLGANCVTWAAAANLRTEVELGVCYDPSVLSIVTQPTANVKRLLLYHNTDIEPEGHAIFVGPQVERTEISMFHLAICYSDELHQKTLAAISLLLGAGIL